MPFGMRGRVRRLRRRLRGRRITDGRGRRGGMGRGRPFGKRGGRGGKGRGGAAFAFALPGASALPMTGKARGDSAGELPAERGADRLRCGHGEGRGKRLKDRALRHSSGGMRRRGAARRRGRNRRGRRTDGRMLRDTGSASDGRKASESRAVRGLRPEGRSGSGKGPALGPWLT